MEKQNGMPRAQMSRMPSAISENKNKKSDSDNNSFYTKNNFSFIFILFNINSTIFIWLSE